MLLLTGFVPALSANSVVYKSDSLISRTLQEELKAAVSLLENVPDREKDWASQSDCTVLELVDPALFPLIYGRTRLKIDGRVALEDVVPFCGEGAVVPLPLGTDLTYRRHNYRECRDVYGGYSKRFQLLPCDLAVDKDGEAKIVSFINNLHPEKHKKLYSLIERVITKAMPMWNCALTDVLWRESPSRAEYEPMSTSGFYPPRIRFTGKPNWAVDYMVPEGEDLETYGKHVMIRDIDGYNRVRSGLFKPEPSRETYEERQNLQQATRPLDLRTEFAGRLQIVVGMANVHLTPEKPEYGGGAWQIVGQLNEHICATVLLFYDDQNVTESYVAFRERVDSESFEYGMKKNWDRGHEGGDDIYHMQLLFGYEEQVSSAIQELGRVLTKEGRLLVFPHVTQQAVEPFRLKDASKPGHRKILALLLVDPYLRIPSTAYVPPQQKEWWSEMVQVSDNHRTPL